MKLITRDADYAIRAVCCIAKNKSNMVTVEELVKCLKMPRPFLRKILQILNRKKILNSYKGIGGGFSLCIKPDRLSLFDIITVLQGPIVLNDHTFKKKPCPHRSSCKVKKQIDRINKIIVKELKKVTIDLVIR